MKRLSILILYLLFVASFLSQTSVVEADTCERDRGVYGESIYPICEETPFSCGSNQILRQNCYSEPTGFDISNPLTALHNVWIFAIPEPLRTRIIATLTFRTVCNRSCITYASNDACTPAGGSCITGGCPSGTSAIGGAALTYCQGTSNNTVCCLPNGGTGGGSGVPPPPPPPRYTRGGTIHMDLNGNCAIDAGETTNLPAGISVSLSGNGVSRNATPGSNGFYSFSGLLYGTYNFVLNLPPGYTSYCRLRYDNVLVNSNRSDYHFGIQPLYTISGSVFNDTNKNYVKDTGEGKGTLGTNFSASGGSLSVNASTGTFTISNLYAGTYTVQYTSPLPSADFENRHPLNGPPQAFSVTVGSGCTYSPLHPVTAGRATCNARGDVSNLNFVVTDSHPWMQSVGLNIRIDSGFTNRIPAAPVYPAYTSIIDNLD